MRTPTKQSARRRRTPSRLTRSPRSAHARRAGNPQPGGTGRLLPLLDPGTYQLDELREGLAEHMEDRDPGRNMHKTDFHMRVHMRVCLSDLLKHGPDSAHMRGAG